MCINTANPEPCHAYLRHAMDACGLQYDFSNWWSVKKVKKSHYMPGQTLRVPEGLDSQISRQSAHEGSKVVNPTHRPPLPPGNIPGTHFF